MALQGVMNRIIRGLLRISLVSRGIGKFLITMYVDGRKSSRRYTVPVAYIRHGGVLLVDTPFRWARNLRTGEPVQIRYMGRRRTADVHVVTDEDGVVADYAVSSNRRTPSLPNAGGQGQHGPLSARAGRLRPPSRSERSWSSRTAAHVARPRSRRPSLVPHHVEANPVLLGGAIAMDEIFKDPPRGNWAT